MTSRRLPVVALWLLERFGVDQDLTGDLIERYARGRSRFWVYRQVLLAIVIGSVRDITRHRLLFARAVVVGVIACNVFAYASFAILQLLIRANYVLASRFPIFPVFITVKFQYPGELFVLGAVIFAATGWVVGRFHRPYGAVMTLGLVAFGWLYYLPELVRHVSNALQHSRYWPYVNSWLIAAMLQSCGLLFGGVIGARGSDSTPPRREATVARGRS